MADSLNLIDLLLSDSEYCSFTNKINECLEDPKVHYINHGLKICEAPNKHFQEHPELLYSIGSDGKKECRLDKSYKNGFSSSDIEFINGLLKTDNKGIVYKNLEYLNKESPKKLEKVIINYYNDRYFGGLKEKITGDFNKNKNFKYSDELLNLLKEELYDEFNISSYKQSIIELFTTQAVYHDEGDEYLKIVVDYAKEGIARRGQYLGNLINEYKELSKSRDYSEVIYEDFIGLAKWLSSEEGRDGRGCLGDIVKFISDGVSSGKYYLASNAKEILELIYSGGVSLSDNIKSEYCTRFSEDTLKYGEIIEIIVENETSISQKSLADIVNGAGKLIKSGEEKQVYNGIYLITRAYKQDESILGDDTKNEIIVDLNNLEKNGSEKLKRVINKCVKELSGIEVSGTEIPEKVLSSSLEEEIKEAVNKANIDFIKLRISEVRMVGEIKYLYVKLGWNEEEIKKLLDAIKDTGLDLDDLDVIKDAGWQEDLTRGIELVYEYDLNTGLIDREGNNAVDILVSGEKGKLGDGVLRVYKDNNIYYPKKAEQIIREIEGEDKNYKLGAYIREQLLKISNIEEKLDKEIEFSYDKEVGTNVLGDKWYLYSIDQKIFLKGLDYTGRLFKENLSLELSEYDKNVLLYRQPYHPNDMESVISAHHKVKLSQFKNTQVDEDNIAEAVVWLKKAMHLTVLGKKYQVRDAQVISLLNLYKGDGGRLIQVSTGEGKTIIIAMFAALNVAMKRDVDIITSSKVLAEENEKEQSGFYKIIGMTSSHNILSVEGAKACYKSDVVYGDLLHFIGDDLRDISKNVKYGRGYDVVIVDEVDNMFVDNTNMKVQLSGGLPGFHYLKGLKTYSWIGFKVNLLLHEEDKGKWYLKGVEELIGKEGELNNHLDGIKNLYIANLIVDESGNYYYEEEGNKILIGNKEEVEVRVKEKIKEYREANIKYDKKEGNYYYKVERKEIGDDEAFTRHIREDAADYIANRLLNLKEGSENRLVNIPRHLNEFMSEHSGQLANSIIMANAYKLGMQYKISNPENKQEKITPVDYLNTGVVQLSLTWSDGLHQYIELKHGLNIKAESLTNVFRSYVGYFLKYEGNIYGMTGTLGKEEHHEYLKEVYKVDTKLMPNYIKKNLEKFKPTVVDNTKDWLDEVGNQAIRKAEYSKRGVLIICKTIDDVDKIYQVIKDDKGYQGRIVRYTDSGYFTDSITEKLISGEVKIAAGGIVVATNLAGRGTDLKIEREVNKNGGLHVILSYYPDSIRVQEQAFGRGARNGDYGSAGLIVENPNKVMDIVELGKDRDEKESKRLEGSKEDTIEQMKRQDELFDKFVDLIARANSPTGYEIVREDKYLPENGYIYVYAEGAGVDGKLIHIKCYKPDSTSYLADIEKSEVSEYIKNISEKSYHHLIDTLSNEARTFNQKDSELIHYFAAEMGCIEKDIEIKGRVDRKYCNSIKGDREFEVLYEKYCGVVGTFSSSKEKVSKERIGELEVSRHKERFELWERDIELYNHKYEIEQLKENWAIWLKKAGTFRPSGLLGLEGSDEKENVEKLNKEYKEFADEQLRLFRNDLDYTNRDNCELNSCRKKERKEYVENELLMKNPSYLVQKSRHYIAQHYNKEVTEDYEYKRDSFSHCKKEDKKDSLLISQPFCETQRAINLATDFAERAVDLDYKFAWNGYNMMAITKLIRDGEGITDYEDAESAAGVKQRFYTDLAATRNSIESFIIPKQSHECGALIISQVVEKDSDTVKQCLFILKSYEKISKHLENLMETVAKAEGDEMIRPSRLYGAEELLDKIDAKELEEGFEMVIEPIEAKQEKEKLEKDLNEGRITEEEYQQRLKDIRINTLGRIGIKDQDNLFNKASKASFRAMTEDLSHDLNLIGFIGYDIEVYELDKDWTDTIIAGLLSIATIAIGIVMLPAGGFIGVLGTSLIAQSVLELVQIGISIDKGIPIDLEQFVKSKGIGIVVAIITAGIAKGLESSGMVSAGNIPGFEGLKEGVSKAAGVIKSLETAAIMGAVDVTSRYVADQYMKKNDGGIEKSIEDAIKAMLLSHGEEVTKILLNDRYNNKFKGQASDKEMRKIVDEALKIIAHYASQGTARQIVSGVAGKAASFFGAIPGAIANLADAAVGYNKAREAVDELESELKGAIRKIASKVSTTKQMMQEKLMQDFPKDAGMIMAEITGGGLLINGGEDIDYNNCHRYQEIEKKSGKGVVGECKYIAGLREEAKKDQENLKNILVKASLGPIRGIYTREVATPIVKSRLVDPILGEGLREGVKDLKKEFQSSWEKREERIEEQEKYRAKMKEQAEGVTKGEQGKYEYVAGVPKNILPEHLRDIREVNTGDKPNAVFKDSTNVETNSNTDNKKVFKSIKVAKDHTVWGIYGNKPTQKQLEEFIKNNPYIAARGVVRDGDGNIKHLEIRAGEEIKVPTNIADAYNNEFTPIVKESSGDSKYIQDICFDPNAGDKYGNIFGVQDTAFRCVEGSCSTDEIYYTSTESPITKDKLDAKNENTKKLTPNQKIVFADAGYEKKTINIKNMLKEGGEKNSKIVKIFTNTEQGSNAVIIQNSEGVLSYNVAGTHPSSIKVGDVKETLKDLETDFYITTDQFKGDLKYRADEIAHNIVQFNQETGNKQRIVVNGHSAGGPPALFAMASNPDLIKEVNMIDSPGVYSMLIKFYGGDIIKAQAMYQNVEIYNANRNLVNSVGDHPPGKLIHHIESDYHKADGIRRHYMDYGSTLMLGRCHMNTACSYQNGEYTIIKSVPTTKSNIAEYYGVNENQVQVVPVTTGEMAMQKNPNPTQIYKKFKIIEAGGVKNE